MKYDYIFQMDLFKPQSSVLRRLPFNYIMAYLESFLLFVWMLWFELELIVPVQFQCQHSLLHRVDFSSGALKTIIGNMLHLMEILLLKRFTTKNKLIFGNNQWYHPMHFPISFTFPFSFHCSLASWFSSCRKWAIIYF